MWRDITEKDKEQYNQLATHPLQAYEWGEFRQQTGIKVIRRGLFEKDKLISAFQITIHPIPHTSWNIGYFPKGTMPTKEILEELHRIGKENKCIFIQLEPNVEKDTKILSDKDIKKRESPNILIFQYPNIKPSVHPLFTKYTLMLDLTKSEEDLLKQMHPKTRYNIKVAQKHEVTIHEDSSEKGFEMYWDLMKETTNRQGFYAHTKKYHELMFRTLKTQNETNNLQAHLLLASYQEQTLVAWILFTFHNTLYYPYGASSSEYRNTMAPNLMMWEAIKFGKKKGLKYFDMWGSLGENPDTKDPWYGFHRFKMGYGPKLVEFVGSYDLIISPFFYTLYTIADRFRWILLKLRLH